jgi:hypothetical protein
MTFPQAFDDNGQSLVNQSALNTVGAVIDAGEIRANSVLVVTSNAGVTAGAVQLQGSIDTVNWFNLGAAVTTNAASTTFPPVAVAASPVRALRAKITTAVVGGTVSAAVAMSV